MLELFCGIGGCAAALPASAEVVAALDINEVALGLYRANFPHPARAATVESIPVATLGALDAELWWLSPPCQPYTVRGKQLDDRDPRARALLALIPAIEELRPRFLALENVPGFLGSRSRGRLLASLESAGYSWRERLLCPTELGVPNRRQRYYLLAGLESLAPWTFEPVPLRPLVDFLDLEAPGRELEPSLAQSYARALDVVDPADPTAVAACFTAAYGHSPVRSGSYLRGSQGPRRFSPREVLRLLGFADTYRLPAELPDRTLWRLAGNSLSVTAVRAVLQGVPGLEPG
ncbi:MAG TPA: DNA cytosine methyltransferase [Thermoanaerobaculia bacterium]|nr:DNA cytosine methyltransferase [Thermoanaerobaculia bacterium]